VTNQLNGGIVLHGKRIYRIAQTGKPVPRWSLQPQKIRSGFGS
jgi:hypothetical protein